MKPGLTVAQFQAIFLLHELGHVLNGLPDDTNNEGLSNLSNKTLINDCFPTLKAL